MKLRSSNYVDPDAFSSAMLRHMVTTQVGGKLDDAEYSGAVSAAIRSHGLKQRDGGVDLREKSLGYLSYVSGVVAENILLARMQGRNT